MAVGDLRTKQRAMKTTSLMLFLTVGLGALGSAGCATMGVGPAVVTDVPKGVEHRPIPNGSSDGVVTQDGVRVSVRVSGTRTDGTSHGLVDWVGKRHWFTPWLQQG